MYCKVICFVFMVLNLIGCVSDNNDPNATERNETDTVAILALIDREAGKIDSSATYQIIRREVLEMSTEGGEVAAYVSDGSLRKLAAVHYGEIGKWSAFYFFKNDSLFLVRKTIEHYKQPFYMGPAEIAEVEDYEWYFQNGKLLLSSRNGQAIPPEQYNTQSDSITQDVNEYRSLFDFKKSD